MSQSPSTSSNHSSVLPTGEEISEQLKEECVEQQEDFGQLMKRVGESICDYSRRQPSTAALAVFVVGIFVGWKVKPW